MQWNMLVRCHECKKVLTRHAIEPINSFAFDIKKTEKLCSQYRCLLNRKGDSRKRYRILCDECVNYFQLKGELLICKKMGGKTTDENKIIRDRQELEACNG